MSSLTSQKSLKLGNFNFATCKGNIYGIHSRCCLQKLKLLDDDDTLGYEM